MIQLVNKEEFIQGKYVRFDSLLNNSLFIIGDTLAIKVASGQYHILHGPAISIEGWTNVRCVDAEIKIMEKK